MNWDSPFVVYRITEDGKLEQVFQAGDLKQAKYWLTYIGQAGDLLCKTPLHPKHSGGHPQAEYWSHKADDGKTLHDEGAWKKFAQGRQCDGSLPAAPSKDATAAASKEG